MNVWSIMRYHFIVYAVARTLNLGVQECENRDNISIYLCVCVCVWGGGDIPNVNFVTKDD